MRNNAPLQNLDDALAQLLAAVQPLAQTESVPTAQALGRVLAVDVIAALDVPPGDNSAMDGYAMRAADVPVPGTVLPISQRIPAGVVGQPLQAGTAARIFTGAQIPTGADAVVMQEECEALAEADGAGSVRVQIKPMHGLSIRRRGEDVARGSAVLKQGTRLTPAALGLAASVGAALLGVTRRPRVALFSTGDELVMPGEVAPEDMPPGAIYNANRYTLSGLLQALGCEVTDLGLVPDQLEATRAALRVAAEGHDLILTSGGVSVGEEDHLRPAVQAEGRLDLWQIAMKPGKPLAFGVIGGGAGSTWFIGLPGNPVSSLVTFLLLVRPVLLRLQGVPVALLGMPRGLPLRSAFRRTKADSRREFVRARLDAEGHVTVYPNQSSGVLTSMVWADGLVDIPAGTLVEPGQTVSFIPMSFLQ
ncbi:MAG: gephyrin-like molybdotransferase Glp [Leptothrix ochracea]|uniref:molybdopterin molybdotransferase MoeA n=1 Tax=Leptothrix ochracea TaxID=735331 RepID=UPI0034E29204